MDAGEFVVSLLLIALAFTVSFLLYSLLMNDAFGMVSMRELYPDRIIIHEIKPWLTA